MSIFWGIALNFLVFLNRNWTPNVTQNIDMSQLLSLAIIVFNQWAHAWSVHGGRDGCYTWAQQLELPFTRADLVWSLQNAQSGSSGSQQFLSWHHFLRWLSNHLVVGWPCWNIFIMQGAAFCPGWSRCPSCGFVFSACSASAITTTCGIIKHPIYCHVFYIA